MKGRVIYKFAALLVIFLFSLAPVAFAAQIPYSTAFGLNKIPNYTKDKNHDQTTLQVVVSAGQEVSLEEVFFKIPIYNSRFSFADEVCISSSCTATDDPNYPANSYLCECQLDWSPSDKTNIIFEYDKDVDGNIDGTSSTTIYPDYLPPELVKAKISQVGQTTSLQFKAEDSACDNCNGKCSGLKEIVISDEEGQVANLELKPDCTIISTNNFNYTKEGEHEFLVTARDQMWESIDDDSKHSDSKTVNFESDFTAPTISDLIIKKNGEKVNYISDSDLIVDLYVNVTDSNLDKISATFSDIGSNTDLTNVLASSYCTLKGDSYECKFSNKKITANQEDISFTFTAIDKAGNSQEKVLTKSLTLDNIKPKVTALKTLNQDESLSYLNKDNNTIVMTIDESGSGFSNKDVYLNLASLGLSNNVQATNCSTDGTTWTCYWNDIKVKNANNGQLLTVSRLGSSKDDAGNMFTADLPAINFKYDDEAPEILGVDVSAIGEFGERYYYQSGDLLKIKVSVDSKGGAPITNVLSDVSSLFNSKTVLNGKCEEVFVEGEENNEICELTTQAIRSGEYNAEIEVKVSDAAGNSDKFSVQIPVYGIISNTPDNFNVAFQKKDLIPKKINRLTASIMPNPPGYKIMVPFKLTGGGSDIEVLHYVVNSCSLDGDKEVFDQMFRDQNNPTPDPIPTLKTVTQAGEENFLELTLARQSGDDLNLLNGFKGNCSVSIYQRYGKKVYQEPEIEPLEFSLEVTGSALPTTPGQEILDKIDEAKKHSMVTSKFIEKGTKLFKKLEHICQYGAMLAGVWNTFSVIENVGVGLKKAGHTAIGKTVFSIGCFGYEGFGGIFAKLYYGGQKLHSSNGKSPVKFKLSNCNSKFDAGETGLGKDRILDGPEKMLVTSKGDSNLKGGAIGEWDSFFKGGGFPGIRNICGFISCEYGTVVSEKLNEVTGGKIFSNNPNLKKGVDEFNKKFMVKGSFGAISASDATITPKNSIIMSAVTFCIPGIFYNLDKYRQIQCQYMMCLKDTALAGGPISICKAQKAQATCLAIFGEVAETVGIFKIIKRVGQQMTTSLSDLLPNVLKATIDKLVCHQSKTESPGEYLVPLLCDLPRAYYNIKDSVNRLKGIAAYGKKETWQLGKDGGDICSQVKNDPLIGWADEDNKTSTQVSSSTDQDMGEGYPNSGGSTNSATSSTTTTTLGGTYP